MHAAPFGQGGEENPSPIQEAEGLLAAGQLDSAHELLVSLLADGHADARTRGLLGLCCFKLGRFHEAADVYAALVRENPSDATLRVNLGLVALKSDRLDEAVENLREAVRLVPGHRKALNYLGLALAQRGDASEAREAFLLAGSAPMAAKMERILAGLEPKAAERAAPAEEARVFPAPPPTEESRGGAALGSLRWDDAVAATPAATPASPPAIPPAPVRASEPSASTQAPAARPAERRPAEIFNFPDRRVERQLKADNEEASDLALAAAMADEAPVAAETPSASPPSTPPMLRPAARPAERPATSLDTFAESHPLSWADGAPFALTEQGNAIVDFEAEIYTRHEGLIAARGDTAWMPVFKRFRGRITERPFGSGPRQIWHASGGGKLLFAGEIGETKRHFTILPLDTETYLVEERVFAFSDDFEFENGRLPGQTQDLPLVRLLGAGEVLLCTERPVRAERIVADECLSLPAAGLIGWAGAINPRLLSAEEGPSVPWVELVGEGIVLLLA